MRVFSAFSGIGAFEKALTNLNIDFELVGFSEIDKNAVKSYCLLNNVDSSLNYGDISLINKEDLPDFDLFTWGFPCQDFSKINVNLKNKGFNGKKSILFFQGLEILKIKRPTYSIAENVSALLLDKYKNELKIIMNSLKDLGYKTKIFRLNAKNYGIPQNRDRVFFVSSLISYPDFNLPRKELSFYAKDILEEEVAEEFFINEEFINKVKNKKSIFRERFKIKEQKDYYIAQTLITKKKSVEGDFIKTKQGIRVLTPKERFILSGWTAVDFEKVKHCSSYQLIKQAGNSIVIQVVEEILKKLLKK